ncbi:small acid-soluble spore protein SspJ [Metabacillus sp. GX 13764]|uniref:small acid-soluble spore protein SspJ n=1 Tax=Metabacillus kandeliae TaxID=2900151 RepID=UPI001E53AA82|nr:small acid-soluble spore protein SspJ [Metabacillus kandeliae]MCD7035784.1 small acid-soluble spore protein SspJ [Metabacillus kandeliae]
MKLFGRDNKESKPENNEALQSSLQEAEQALQGDPLKEAVENKKNESDSSKM